MLEAASPRVMVAAAGLMRTVINRQRVERRPGISIAPLGDLAEQCADIRPNVRNSGTFAEIAVGDQAAVRSWRSIARVLRAPIEQSARQKFRFRSHRKFESVWGWAARVFTEAVTPSALREEAKSHEPERAVCFFLP